MNDMLRQLQLYEYLGKEQDPLYKTILYIQQNSSMYVLERNIYITKTEHGFYELASKWNHECFSTPESLYIRLSDLLNE